VGNSKNKYAHCSVSVVVVGCGGCRGRGIKKKYNRAIVVEAKNESAKAKV